MNAIEKGQRFNEIYNQYSKLVWWHIGNKVVTDKANKEDMTQDIWMAVGNAIDRIEPGKEHAFIYKCIVNRINKFFYYNTRDKKVASINKEESSEGKEFNLIDITNELDQVDDYSYFELLDVIESTLTEKEFQLFIEYYQGMSLPAMARYHHKGHDTMVQSFISISDKLTAALEMEATLPLLYKKRNKNGQLITIRDKKTAEPRVRKKPGPKDYKMTEEHRRKISEALKGKNVGDKNGMSAANRAKRNKNIN